MQLLTANAKVVMIIVMEELIIASFVKKMKKEMEFYVNNAIMDLFY
jgi:hypothetical protein